MLVTAVVRAGGGMPQRIVTISVPASVFQMTGAGKWEKTPGIGGKLPTWLVVIE
jgi:hypothetical protein